MASNGLSNSERGQTNQASANTAIVKVDEAEAFFLAAIF